ASHSDSAAVLFETIDISEFMDTLKQGENLLAIHGMNSSATSSDFLISAELTASGGDTGDSDLRGVIEYTGPITLPHSVNVKARVKSGNTWSALNEAVYAVGPVAENLRITEIMYNPPRAEGVPPSDRGQDARDTEFIELQNTGYETMNYETMNLNLVSFTNGIDFTFPSIELSAGERIVVVRDKDIFEARYGTDIKIAGQYSGSLNNAGERIELEDAIGNTIHNFRYRDGWRSITDGDGFSLTIIDAANPDPNSWGQKDSWRPSVFVGGSPGSDDSGVFPLPGTVVINEVLAHSHGGAPDWIELYNSHYATINVSGWFLSDSSDNLLKYEIPNGTRIGPRDYLVLYEDLNFGNPDDPGCHEPFALSENGERLFLSVAYDGVLAGYRSTEDFGASETGISLGRHYKASTNNYNFVAMDENTPGSANAYPKVGPIVISEIMYHPDWPQGGSFTNDQYEYIELQNISAEPVKLYRDDKAEPWKFTDGIDFTFPADIPVTIPAGGLLLVVKHPAAFSWRYPAVPAEIIFGPYEGRLNNAGESLELGIPGDLDNDGFRQYIRVDRVNYSDGSHPENCPGGIDLWPTEADGSGMALKRKVLTDYGNDPDNWLVSIPSPGK
ncbi:MAG: lamin tail domain-containing protein, partial [Planctomycetota bacterium]